MTKKESTSVKAYGWSLTVWMPPYTPKSWQETIDQAVASNPKWSVHGQKECGDESGKLHYQLFLKTPDQPRKSKIIRFLPKVHVESETNRNALEKYVHKEDTRVGEFKTIERSHITFKECVRKFMEWLDQQDILDDDFSADEKLKIWDEFIEFSVAEGVNVDIIGVNPQYRCCISKYWKGYVQNYIRQDKQDKTVENNVAEVSIPVVDARKDEEINSEEFSEETSQEDDEIICEDDDRSEFSESNSESSFKQKRRVKIRI